VKVFYEVKLNDFGYFHCQENDLKKEINIVVKTFYGKRKKFNFILGLDDKLEEIKERILEEE
jgi:hypothetical protein